MTSKVLIKFGPYKICDKSRIFINRIYLVTRKETFNEEIEMNPATVFVLAFVVALAQSATICQEGVTRRFPHPTEASKYFQCQDGALEKMICQHGKVFSKTSDKCVFKRSFSDANDDDDDDDDISVICSMSDDGKVVFVPHPYNCQKFFMCQYALPILMKCPANLHFDNVLHVCNYPEEAHCVPTPKPTLPTTTMTSTESTTSEHT